ncbi:MAG: DNRLRE domain-containing protein [Candidatus Methylomirabilales bacterium]
MISSRQAGRVVPLFLLAALGLLLALYWGLPLFKAPAQAQSESLIATQDTYIRRFRPNKNQGGQTILRVRSLGRNRSLVQFDPDEIAAAVGANTLVSATLRLYIVANAHTWGKRGRDVAVHRMTHAWTELGATWNCPDDTDPGNFRPDCTRWNMRQMRRWPFVRTPTDVTRHHNGQSGWVAWDASRPMWRSSSPGRPRTTAGS